jgi:hypothetical protein
MLYPNTLLGFYEAWMQYPESLVYGDCDTEKEPGVREYWKSGRWTWEKMRSEAVYQVTTLFAKQWWEAVGGYPTDQETNIWEDWLFAVKLHIVGIGATYVQKPWGVYRHWTAGEGGKSKNDIDNAGYGSPEFVERNKRLQGWIERKEYEMPCPSCREKRGSRTMPTIYQGQQTENPGTNLVVVYEGDKEGAFMIKSRVVPRRTYRIQRGQPMTISPGDDFIATMDGFRRVEREEQDRPALPTTPPVVPSVRLETPQPTPVTSFADAVRAEVAEALQPTNDGVMERVGALRWVELDALHEVGFDSAEDIRQDLLENGGKRLLAIKGVGPSTLRKIRGIVLA